MANSQPLSPSSANTTGLDPKARLFAVVCGINDYESRDFLKLHGAQADATNVNNFLVSNYQVPQDHIRFLLGKAASRLAIISALVDLSTDPRIHFGDAILFYFAGHGSEIYPPEGWECGGPRSKIQVLVPQDYCSKPGLEIPGIPDRTIGYLLDKIACSKGDNITVIFDCCHSASGTRGDSIRSVELDPSIHTNALDIDIRGEGAPRSGLNSHVLLSACSPHESARERNCRGAFTTEILKVFQEHSPDEIRYREILHKINPIDGQNPQCEGAHQDRYLFNSRVSSPAPISYILRRDPESNALVIDAGTAHGVTNGAEFAFYVAQDSNARKNPLGTYVVDEAMAFHSILKPTGDMTISTSSLPPGVVAFQTKLGEGSALRLYVRDSSPSHRDFILKAYGDNRDDIQFVHSRDEAQLELAVQENRVVITVRDTKATQQGRYQLPTTQVPWDKLGSFLQDAQSSFRKRDHCGTDTGLIKDVDLEFFKLQYMPSPFQDIPEPELSPSSSNLHHDGMINLVVGDGSSYGVKLTNIGPDDLYPILLYFDSSDPTRIHTYYQPPSSGPFLLDAPLKKDGGTLTIGYGSGGMLPFSYSLSGNINVGFLKLSVSTRPLNSSSASAGLAPRETWGTTTICMIQRSCAPRYTPSPCLPKMPNTVSSKKIHAIALSRTITA